MTSLLAKYNLQYALLIILQNYDAMIVRSDTKVTADVLAASAASAGGRLKVVGRAGAGVDNIDIPSATENKVLVLK